MKNDIFVFHAPGFNRIDGMKLSRQDDGEGRTLYRILFQIYRDQSLPLFDIDQLHFIMPVQRHVGKIQRDCANIGIVGKAQVPVSDVFMIILIFKYIHNFTVANFFPAVNKK